MVISKTEIREKPTAQATQVPATPTPIPILRIEPQRIELNGAWRLRADPGDEGENEGWYDVAFDDSNWTEVMVPHTWGTMAQHADYEEVARAHRRYVERYGQDPSKSKRGSHPPRSNK